MLEFTKITFQQFLRERNKESLLMSRPEYAVSVRAKKKVTKRQKTGKQKFTSYDFVDLMGIGPITISVLGRFASKEHVSPFNLFVPPLGFGPRSTD